MNAQPAGQPHDIPQPSLWRKLLSGSREQIMDAAAQISAAGLTDGYAALLLVARRRNARYRRRLLGVVPLTTGYAERERRSALTALGVLWGALGRELGMALDPKASHFDRELAHKALIRRRDQRAVGPLVDALLSGHALEDWQCIPTLGALGDLQAADALLRYIGLYQGADRSPASSVLDMGIDIGRALRDMNARHVLKTIQDMLKSPLAFQRTGAALVIAGWGDDKLAASLIPLLVDPVIQVRVAAINALGELKAVAAFEPLQESVTDPDPDVSGAAEKALQQVILAHPQRSIKVSKLKHPKLIQR